jgi:hypothetical protein
MDDENSIKYLAFWIGFLRGPPILHVTFLTNNNTVSLLPTRYPSCQQYTTIFCILAIVLLNQRQLTTIYFICCSNKLIPISSAGPPCFSPSKRATRPEHSTPAGKRQNTIRLSWVGGNHTIFKITICCCWFGNNLLGIGDLWKR